jgi:hypothetical protein
MCIIQAQSASTPQLHSMVVANACCSTSPTREYAPAPQACPANVSIAPARPANLHTTEARHQTPIQVK